jgi:hypothetical protein
MSEDVTLRDYREDDVEQIFSLMSEIYDEDVVANSRRHWRWQYHDNPRNPDGRVAIRLVDRAGEIVAMIAGIRQEFYLGGEIASGLWVVDFMARQAGTSHKERLRYGQRLAFELRDTQPLVAGVNRPALNRYWKRVLGDQVDICAVPMMLRPLRVESLARRKVRNPVLATAAGLAGRVAAPLVFRSRHKGSTSVRLERTATFDRTHDELWQRVAPSFSHLAVRDAAYLNWRYVDPPDRTYACVTAFRGDEPCGFIVTRRFRDEELLKGRIVDVLARSDDVETWAELVGGAVERFRDDGCDLVHGLGSTVPAIMEAYKMCGFRSNPEHARTSQYIAYTNLESVDKNAFYDGDNWHVSLGDADTDFATPE